MSWNAGKYVKQPIVHCWLTAPEHLLLIGFVMFLLASSFPQHTTNYNKRVKSVNTAEKMCAAVAKFWVFWQFGRHSLSILQIAFIKFDVTWKYLWWIMFRYQFPCLTDKRWNATPFVTSDRRAGKHDTPQTTTCRFEHPWNYTK